jgi:hypothetical protein
VIENLPDFVLSNYECMEWNHATAILRNDFPEEWHDICGALCSFRLLRSEIAQPGGRKSMVAARLDNYFETRGWVEKSFDTRQMVDGAERVTPTHSIDCYRNRIGLEIEWNNKDPFFDRDLNNFRLLFELKALSVGVIITRSTELQRIFDDLDRGASYGSSTTHFDKLRPRIQGAASGGCPVLAFGISAGLYVDDRAPLRAPFP